MSIKLNALITKSKINLSDFNVIVVKNFLHKFCILTFHKHDKIFTIFGHMLLSNIKWINGFINHGLYFQIIKYTRTKYFKQIFSKN